MGATYPHRLRLASLAEGPSPALRGRKFGYGVLRYTDRRGHMRIRTVCLIAALTALALPAHAASAKNCSTIQTQGAMNTCFSDEWKQADDALNRKYQALVARLKAQQTRPEAFTLLRDSERAWISYRDTQCDFETYQNKGGSVHSGAISMCMTKMTNDRITLLDAQLDCSEGDLTCVAPSPSQQ